MSTRYEGSVDLQCTQTYLLLAVGLRRLDQLLRILLSPFDGICDNPPDLSSSPGTECECFPCFVPLYAQHKNAAICGHFPGRGKRASVINSRLSRCNPRCNLRDGERALRSLSLSLFFLLVFIICKVRDLHSSWFLCVFPESHSVTVPRRGDMGEKGLLGLWMTRSSARNKGQLGSLGTAHAFLFVDGPWVRGGQCRATGSRQNDRAGLKNRSVIYKVLLKEVK